MSDEPSKLDVEIGSILRRHREAAGMTQGAVGRIVGRHQSRVGHVEAGTRRLLVSELAAYARAVGVTPVDLLPRRWIK